MIYSILLSIIAGIIIGFILFLVLMRRGAVGEAAKTAEGPAFSEKEVENLLLRHGYQILQKRPRQNILTVVDGQEHFGYIEADYKVQKQKKDYLVLVKTPSSVFDPNEPILRRKLLEIDYAFAPQAVLWVDPEQAEIHALNFSFPQEKSLDRFFRGLIILFIILLIIGIIWLLVQARLI